MESTLPLTEASLAKLNATEEALAQLHAADPTIPTNLAEADAMALRSLLEKVCAMIIWQHCQP